jgi:Kef-type K+ transport system membrane component KefB
MQTLFWIGVLFIIGYYTGSISQRFKLPKVSGYILIGIFLSPSVSHILPHAFLIETQSIVYFSLALIAFMIGGSLQYTKTKNLGKTIFTIMFSASQMTFVIVSIGVFVILLYIDLGEVEIARWQDMLNMALFLGAIGIATAPAAVLAVIHEYQARGPLSTILLGIVATDDALALINFTLVISIATIISGNHHDTLLIMLLEPFGMIALSLLFGVATGWIHAKLIEKIADENSLIILTFGMLLVLFTTAESLELDGILVCMAYGMMLVNITQKSEKIFETIREHFEEVIFVLFFILSGASVELSLLMSVWPIVLVYIILRMMGKITGSWIGAKIVHANPVIEKNIGIAQMPQAGVAIGLALALYHHPEFTQLGEWVLSIVIAATAINEVIGPYFLKIALFRANEVYSKKD